MFGRKYGTNQNFIARPSNAYIYSAGRQDKSLPQTFNQFIAPTQLEHIDGGRNFGEQRKLRVSVSGSIRNRIFSERVLFVPNNLGSPQNFVMLPLQLIFSQRIAVENNAIQESQG